VSAPRFDARVSVDVDTKQSVRQAKITAFTQGKCMAYTARSNDMLVHTSKVQRVVVVDTAPQFRVPSGSAGARDPKVPEAHQVHTCALWKMAKPVCRRDGTIGVM
jgi:hypothetical protein